MSAVARDGARDARQDRAPGPRDAIRSATRRPALRRLLAAAAFGAALLAANARAQVLVVLSDASEGYAGVAAELRSGLAGGRADGARVDSVTAARLAAIDDGAFAGYRLVVTVGLAAAQTTVAREDGRDDAPRTLCVLVPRQSFEHLAQGRRRERLSAVYIDQPLARQLDLLRLALPERHRVGVIVGPASQGQLEELKAGAQVRSLAVASAAIAQSSELYGALQTVMPASDVLLLLPDPVVANPDTVYGLLLTTYRAQLPVAGFSAGLANAGTLLSLYSTAQQQGRQAAEIAAAALARDGALPAPAYPKYFTVKVNADVARSLALHVPGVDALTEALARAEPAHAESAAPAKDRP